MEQISLATPLFVWTAVVIVVFILIFLAISRRLASRVAERSPHHLRYGRRQGWPEL
jgi:uncharacterized membrane protein YhiD involved in acid resistance